MPVTDQQVIIEHIANGSTGTFPYTFFILDEDQLKVYIDNVLQTGGYTVTGVGNPSGGSVIFASDPADQSIVRLARETPVIRETDYIEGGGLPAETLDADQDYQTMILQEIDQYSMKKDIADDSWDAGGSVIKNVGDPVNNQDAVTKSWAEGQYVNVSGDTMTGLLTLSGDPVDPLNPVTLQYLTTNYYTKNFFDTGGLDTRYYTESELDGGVLDVRYPTYSWLSSNYYDKTQLDGGQLDNRYYTESEIDARTINDLSDVDTTAAVINDTLVYNGSQWVAQPAVLTLDDLQNVDEAGKQVDDVLSWDGSNWVPSAPVLNFSDLQDTDFTGLQDGHYVYWDATSSKWKPTTGTTGTLDSLTDVTITNVSDREILQFDSATNDWVNRTFAEADLYTATQLNAGQLDNRYYTKTNLDSGQLDNRYYTETEIDNNFYTKTDLDNGQLDNRYSTKEAIRSEQAVRHGVLKVATPTTIETLYDVTVDPRGTLSSPTWVAVGSSGLYKATEPGSYGSALPKGWQEVGLFQDDFTRITTDGTRWVAGDDVNIFVSTDLTTWTDVTPAGAITATKIGRLIYSGGVWMATAHGGTGGEVWRSTDGNTWTVSLSFQTGYNLVDIDHDTQNDRWIAVTEGGTIFVSDDQGGSWTKYVVGIGKTITWGNGRWLSCGDQNAVYYSDDGINWTTASMTTDGSYELSVVKGTAFNPVDNIFYAFGRMDHIFRWHHDVGSGSTPIILSSKDCINWKEVDVYSGDRKATASWEAYAVDPATGYEVFAGFELHIAFGGHEVGTVKNHPAMLTKELADDTYQPLDGVLTDISGQTPLKGRIFVGNGTDWTFLNPGADNKVLTCLGSASQGLVWTDPPSASPGGGDTQVQFNNSGSFEGDADFVYDSANNYLKLLNSGRYHVRLSTSSDLAGYYFEDETGLNKGTIYYSGTAAMDKLVVGATAGNGILISGTSIEFSPTSGAVTIDGMQFPTTPGTSGQVLTTDGVGTLSWTTPTGSGVTEFLQLNDTPANYSGQSGNLVAVNAGETALEFVSTIDGGSY